LPEDEEKSLKKISLNSCYLTWLTKEILKYKPTIVIAVGAEVLSLLLPDKTGIMKNRGVFFDSEIEEHKFKIIPTLSPGYLLQKGRELDSQVISDLRRAFAAVTGGIDSWSTDKLKDLTYRTVENIEDFREMFTEIKEAGYVACDIESRGLDMFKTAYPDDGFPLVSIQFSTKEGSGWFLPVAHTRYKSVGNPAGTFFIDTPMEEEIRTGLKYILEGKVYLIGHNFKFDSKWILQWLGIRPKLSFDTMLTHGLFEQTSSGLKNLAWSMTSIGGYEEEQAKYTESLETDQKWDMFYYPFEQLATYGCCDTDVTLRIYNILSEKLESEPKLKKLAQILVRASNAFLDIEFEGIKIDTPYLHQLGIDLNLERMKLEADFKELAVEEIKEFEEELLAESWSKAHPDKQLKNKITEFNIASSDHICTIFYDKMHFPVNDRYRSKKTKEASVGKQALELLGQRYPIATVLLKWRTVAKQLAGFVDSYPEFIDQQNKIHPDYKLVKYYNSEVDKTSGAGTGRLACSSPNMQNVPSRGDGKKIKKLFIPDYENHYLVDCVAPETRILTSNFIWKKAEDLVVGEKLIGFDEKLDRNTKLRTSVVEKISTRHSERYRVVTDKGTVICSGDHSWAAYKQYKKCYGKRNWYKTVDLQPGYHISFICTPWDTTDTYKDGWMCGMFEGEGWVTKRGGAGIGQNPGSLLDRVREQLIQDGFTFNEYVQENHKCVQLTLNGAFAPMRVIGKYNIKRLRDKYDYEGMRSWSRNTNPATVISVEKIEDGPVVSIKTSTKTYIAEGLFSHNCDFSGIEMRVAAMYSGDPLMLKFFSTGTGDFHRYVGSKIHNIPEDQVTDMQRTYAKSTTFGVLFGAGPSKIAEQIKCQVKEAQKFIDDYFNLFPSLKKWISKQKNFAIQNQYVVSHFGRKRMLPDASSKNEMYREAALRQAVNGPIQADASDITLLALTRIAEYLRKFNHFDPTRPSALRASVHDSILLSVHENDLDEIVNHVKFNILENPMIDFITESGVQLASEVSIGRSWGDQRKVKFE